MRKLSLSVCLMICAFETLAWAMDFESWDQMMPANERFVSVLSDNAILDRETGAVWEKSPGTSTYVWANATIHCINKNVGGRKGWRLPSVDELASLVDPTNTSPALPSNHPFLNIQSSTYWSSTSGWDTSTAWWTRLSDGLVSGGPKTGSYYVWCVRGGAAQGRDMY